MNLCPQSINLLQFSRKKYLYLIYFKVSPLFSIELNSSRDFYSDHTKFGFFHEKQDFSLEGAHLYGIKL
jgi:hypothetical protein